MAGDLNFITSSDEVWGLGELSDTLASFFRDLLKKNNLVDAQPSILVPTWHNDRSGVDGIQKRSDRFYATESLLDDTTRYRYWVVHPYILDHAPMIFQLDHGYNSVAYPFKFNPAFLIEESFGYLVRSEWSAI